jgi:hypothetical protein
MTDDGRQRKPANGDQQGQFLRAVAMGDPRTYQSMTVIPLLFARDRGPRYIALSEAIERGSARVSEVSEGGSVPNLTIVNLGDEAVLVLDGEELRGAKQNRVLNTSILVGARSEIIVPVSCTEQGRWRYDAPVFDDSGVVAERRVRRELRRSVNVSLMAGDGHRSDQRLVWDEVADLHRRAATSSPTQAMRDVFDKRGSDLRGYLDSFPLAEGQHGLLVLRGRQVAGLDVVSRAPTYACVHAKLLQSYALEALTEGDGKEALEAAEALDLARGFIDGAAATPGLTFKSPGLGWDVRFQAPGVLGSALLVGDNGGRHGGVHKGAGPQIAVHGAFFRIEETGERRRDGAARLAGYERRRGYRGWMI